jgi:hypothetical protein
MAVEMELLLEDIFESAELMGIVEDVTTGAELIACDELDEPPEPGFLEPLLPHPEKPIMIGNKNKQDLTPIEYLDIGNP